MESSVKIYIPVKKPEKTEEKVKQGETTGYPIHKNEKKQ